MVQGCKDIPSGGETTDWSFPLPGDLARNTFRVMATTAASERVLSTDGHVVNTRREI